MPAERTPYTQLRVVRSVLISAAAKPAIDQLAIGKDTNEGGIIPEVFETLLQQFPSLFEICTL
jgi:hypothetical protein